VGNLTVAVEASQGGGRAGGGGQWPGGVLFFVGGSRSDV